MRHISLLGLGLLVANSAHADLGSIPKESGWSGFLLGGIMSSTTNPTSTAAMMTTTPSPVWAARRAARPSRR